MKTVDIKVQHDQLSYPIMSFRAKSRYYMCTYNLILLNYVYRIMWLFKAGGEVKLNGDGVVLYGGQNGSFTLRNLERL